MRPDLAKPRKRVFACVYYPVEFIVTINRAEAHLNVAKFQFYANSVFRIGRFFIFIAIAETSRRKMTGPSIDIYNRAAWPSFKPFKVSY